MQACTRMYFVVPRPVALMDFAPAYACVGRRQAPVGSYTWGVRSFVGELRQQPMVSRYAVLARVGNYRVLSWADTVRLALGAVLVYQLALLLRHDERLLDTNSGSQRLSRALPLCCRAYTLC
jgi:hypothetical protein